jgi:hypothetical protein
LHETAGNVCFGNANHVLAGFALFLREVIATGRPIGKQHATICIVLQQPNRAIPWVTLRYGALAYSRTCIASAAFHEFHDTVDLFSAVGLRYRDRTISGRSGSSESKDQP